MNRFIESKKESLGDFFRFIGRWLKAKAVDFWRGLRRLSHNCALLFLPALLVASLILGVVCVFRINAISRIQYDQQAASFWSGSSSNVYSQLTCVARWQAVSDGGPSLPLDSVRSLTVREIDKIHASLEEAVLASENARSDREERRELEGGSEEPRAWIDAYSSELLLGVTRPKSDLLAEMTTEARITAVGGDYSLIHRMHMLSGSFFTEISYGTRPVVLDEGLAFSLFSSSDIVGNEIKINGRTFTVSGVVRKNPGKEMEASYGQFPRAYIAFPDVVGLSQGGPIPSPEENAGPRGSSEGKGSSDADGYAVMYYEVVLPDHLSGIARQFLRNAFEANGKTLDKDFLVIENTGRFQLARLWDQTFPLGLSRHAASEYTLSYYELAANIAQERIFFWWIVFFFSVFSALSGGVGTYCRFAKKRALQRKEKRRAEEDFDIRELR